MWSCDWSTIRLGAMPKQLDVHDLHMDTHKLSHLTQIQLIFNSTSKTTNYQQQTQKKKIRADTKTKGLTCARRGQGRVGSGRRAGSWSILIAHREQWGCSTRRRRECWRVGVVIGVMFDVTTTEARFQPEPAPAVCCQLGNLLSMPVVHPWVSRVGG